MEVNTTRFPSGIPALANWLHGKGRSLICTCCDYCLTLGAFSPAWFQCCNILQEIKAFIFTVPRVDRAFFQECCSKSSMRVGNLRFAAKMGKRLQA
jgi:hypothetical protein